MPKNVMCKNCNNYRNDWCEMVLDSPDPDIVRDCRHFWPKTNADRIRAMTDEELARFIANKIVNIENHKMIEQGHTPTATQLSALGHTCYCTLVQWLKKPAEGDA